MSQEKDESDKVIRIFKSGNVILFFCLIEILNNSRIFVLTL